MFHYQRRHYNKQGNPVLHVPLRCLINQEVRKLRVVSWPAGLDPEMNIHDRLYNEMQRKMEQTQKSSERHRDTFSHVLDKIPNWHKDMLPRWCYRQDSVDTQTWQGPGQDLDKWGGHNIPFRIHTHVHQGCHSLQFWSAVRQIDWFLLYLSDLWPGPIDALRVDSSFIPFVNYQFVALCVFEVVQWLESKMCIYSWFFEEPFPLADTEILISIMIVSVMQLLIYSPFRNLRWELVQCSTASNTASSKVKKAQRFLIILPVAAEPYPENQTRKKI